MLKSKFGQPILRVGLSINNLIIQCSFTPYLLLGIKYKKTFEWYVKLKLTLFIWHVCLYVYQCRVQVSKGLYRTKQSKVFVFE